MAISVKMYLYDNYKRILLNLMLLMQNTGQRPKMTIELNDGEHPFFDWNNFFFWIGTI